MAERFVAWAYEDPWWVLLATMCLGTGISFTGLLVMGWIDRWLLPVRSERLRTFLWLPDHDRG